MKDRISELMDGELEDRYAAQAIESIGRDAEALQTWRTYHLISDAMRQSRALSEGFTTRVAQRLAAEPTVLAPRALPAQPRRWFAVPAAASVVAAVGLVGWMAFGPQPQAPAPASAPVAQAQPDPKPQIVPLPSAASDYLLAHQGFSPRISFQGMAPYVRTVSEQTVESRK
jgi:sigma-E factor negative regulatory protein RseA